MRGRPALAAVLIALAVLAASLLPGSAAGGLPAGADKLLHATGYAALAFLTAAAIPARTRAELAGVAVCVAAVGAGVELLQPLVGRNASLLDALANLAGATAGGVAYGSLSSRFSKY